MNKGASVREQDKQHISRKFRVNTILTTSRKEKKEKTKRTRNFWTLFTQSLAKCVMIYANITGKKNALTTKMILFHVSIAVLWLTEICRRIVACRCIAKGDTHSHLMNINKIENSALNTNFKANERKKPTTIRIK